jgi:ribose/xylose/arabinose/galactoside ABC-type transport system permease subunit/ABC-type sugar transport system substrate-binding protein
MKIDRRTACALFFASLGMPAFGQARRQRTVALLLDSLASPFWQASLAAIKKEATGRGWDVLEAVSNADDNRQYQQVLSMIRRGVDGIIIVHTDAKAVVPAIRAANAAGVPMVHFNRMPEPSDAYSVAVVADNRKIMRDTVVALAGIARARGGQYRAAILLGDLSDPNAIARRDGFQEVIDRNTDLIQVVARIATDWNADKAFAGLTNALRAHPEINLLVSSSDFLTPQIEQALRAADKWHPAADPRHVLIASFDGDASAYAMLASGYFDVDGIQNLDFEVKTTCDAMEQIWAGQRPPKILSDPGLVISRDRLEQQRDQMWGYGLWKDAQPVQGTALATSGSTSVPVASVARGQWSLSSLLIGLTALAHALFSAETGVDIALAMLPLAILGTGQMLVLIVGQIDLSVTATMALCSVLSASAMSHYGHVGEPIHTASGIAIALLVGAGIGAFNGMCTALLRMPAFIVTLAVMMSGAGAAIWYASAFSDTKSIGGLSKAFIAIGYGTPGGVPVALLLCVAMLVGAQWILSRTLLGRWLFAVGHNKQAARISGVPVNRVTIVAFTMSGVCAALAAIIYTARLETGQPTLGDTMLLDIVGAAVIGGVSLFGGRGSIWMVLGGVLFLSLLDKVLQLLGLSLFLVLAIKGAAILLAAILDAARRRRSTS